MLGECGCALADPKLDICKINLTTELSGKDGRKDTHGEPSGFFYRKPHLLYVHSVFCVYLLKNSHLLNLNTLTIL